jgi:glycerophosphoryl diester phosphodiesterase
LTEAGLWLWDVLHPPPPRILPPPPEGAFLLVGHRGAPAREVENTLPSFDRALDEGANAIETDLCVTKDGEVVLWHDWDPDDLVAFARQAGAEFDVRCRPVAPPEGPHRRPVCDLTLAEFRAHYGYAEVGGEAVLPARIPRLEDLVAWASARPALRAVVLDVKVPADRADLAPALCAALRRALDAHPCAAPFVWLSPHREVVEEFRRADASAGRSLDVEVPPGLPRRAATLSAVRPAIEGGNRFASIGRPRFTFGGWGVFERILRSDLGALSGAPAGVRVPEALLCWTINRPREMRHLVRMGVHGVLTDLPARLRKEAARARRRA